MRELLQKICDDSIVVLQRAFRDNEQAILTAVEDIASALKADGKILFFGNGGSAADSQHIAAEFVGRFQKERQALAAIALTTDTSVLTALANDYGFDTVFARQIAALGWSGDVAVGISTSGNSKNVIAALKQAKEQGLKTVSFTGNGGGELALLSDVAIVVPSSTTARIQESHICIAHCICELVEDHFA